MKSYILCLVLIFCLVTPFLAGYSVKEYSEWNEEDLVDFLYKRGHTCKGCSSHSEYVQYALQIQYLPELTQEQLDKVKSESLFQPDVDPDTIKNHINDMRSRDIRTIVRLSLKSVVVVISIYATIVAIRGSRHSFGGLMFILAFAFGLLNGCWHLISDVARSQNVVQIRAYTDGFYPYITPWLPFLIRWHHIGMNLGMVNSLNIPTLIFILLFIFLDISSIFIPYGHQITLFLSFLLIIGVSTYRKLVTGGIRGIVATSVLFSSNLSLFSLLMVHFITMPPLLSQYISLEDLSCLISIIVVIVNANLSYIRPSWIYNMTDEEIMEKAKAFNDKKKK